MIKLFDNEKLNKEQLDALIGKIRAIVYARVSTDDQAKHGYSLDSQVERCVQKAYNKFGISSDEIIALVEEGYSGDDPERPALKYALYLLEQGIGQKIFFLHPDRMSRYLSLQTQISQRVWSAGCDIEFVEMDLDKNNPESMLMFNIQGSIAQYNKAKILANSKRGRRTKAKNGKISGARRLYGYSFDKENDTFIENDEEKQIYLKIVDLFLNKSMGLLTIAKELSKLGIPAPSGNKWYQSTIGRILRNESYTGNYYYGRTEVVQMSGKTQQINKAKEDWIKIPIPQYIDEITFMNIQEKLEKSIKKNNGRPSDEYLLKGLVKCGRCGSSLVSGVTSRTKDKLLKYYSCSKKSPKGYDVGNIENTARCLGRNFRVDILDEHIWNSIHEKIRNPKSVVDLIVQRQEDTEKLNELLTNKNTLEKTLSDKTSERKNYIKLCATGKIDESELDEMLQDVDITISAIKDDLLVLGDLIKGMSTNLDNATRAEKILIEYQNIINEDELTIKKKREILNATIKKVVVFDDMSVDIIWQLDEIAHKNIYDGQGDGLVFYVDELIDLPKPKHGGDSVEHKYEKFQSKLDRLLKMYREDLLTFEEIADKMNTDWWTIKTLFRKNDIQFITIKERAKLKRTKDFKKIYDLLYVQKMSMNEIYRRYKISPSYTRKVIQENLGDNLCTNFQEKLNV